ncbi:MAG: helix-turn-helix transcriptional regulator [Chloroflexi bacterium]|nr:helix-turn-helix transcriptional regulator [Chloroflexota bacterium]
MLIKKSLGLFVNRYQLLASLLFGISHSWLIVLVAFSNKYFLPKDDVLTKNWTSFATFVFLYICGMLLGGLSFQDTYRSRTVMKTVLYGNLAILFLFMIPGVHKTLSTILLVLIIILGGMLTSLWGIYLYKEDFRSHFVQTMYLNLLAFIVFIMPANIPAMKIQHNIAFSIAIVYNLISLVIIRILPLEKKVHIDPDTSDNAVIQNIYSSNIVKTFAFFLLLFSITVGFLYTGILPHYVHRSIFVDIIWIVTFFFGYYLIYGRNIQIRIKPLIIGDFLSFGFAVILFVFAPHTSLWLILLSVLPVNFLIYNLLILFSFSEHMLQAERNYPEVLAVLLSFCAAGVIIGLILGDRVSRSENQSLNILTASFILILLLNTAIPFIMPGIREYRLAHSKQVPKPPEAPGTATDVLIQECDILPLEELTKREKQIAGMIAAGYTLQNIADELIISKNTVKYHMKNIYMKLHVTNRVEFMNRYHEQEKPE